MLGRVLPRQLPSAFSQIVRLSCEAVPMVAWMIDGHPLVARSDADECRRHGHPAENESHRKCAASGEAQNQRQEPNTDHCEQCGLLGSRGDPEERAGEAATLVPRLEDHRPMVARVSARLQARYTLSSVFLRLVPREQYRT